MLMKSSAAVHTFTPDDDDDDVDVDDVGVSR